MSYLPTPTVDQQNVSTARGSLDTVPLRLLSETEESLRDMVADFASSVCSTPPQPLLVSSPPRRQSRPVPPEHTIRRSERLAQKSRIRATKPVVQAQNVLMKKLGITSEQAAPDATSFQQYTATFSSNLSDSHCKALDELLPSGLGSFQVADPLS